MTRSQPIIQITRRGRNLVIRRACSRHGEVLGHLVEHHNGSHAGMVAAAKRVSRRMFEWYDEASNINSQIVATDEHGLPRWTISPNFRVVSQL